MELLKVQVYVCECVSTRLIHMNPPSTSWIKEETHPKRLSSPGAITRPVEVRVLYLDEAVQPRHTGIRLAAVGQLIRALLVKVTHHAPCNALAKP